MTLFCHIHLSVVASTFLYSWSAELETLAKMTDPFFRFLNLTLGGVVHKHTLAKVFIKVEFTAKIKVNAKRVLILY